MTIKLAALIGTTTLGLMVASPATAATGIAADGLTAMRELNLIVLGDLATQQHVQGKAYIGGNATGRVIVAQGGSQGYQSNGFAQLTIGGNTTGFVVEKALGEPLLARVGGNAEGMALNGTGAVQVGGTANVQNFNPSANKTVTYGTGTTGGQAQDAAWVRQDNSLSSLKAGIAAQTATFAADLGALLTHLTTLASISTITSTATALDYSAAVNGYAVYTMTAAAFQDQNANFDNLFGTRPAGITTIVNVLGTNLTQGGNINGTALNQSVIWNFAQATAISTKGWHGSILAPLATLTNSSAIEGSVAVKNFVMNGEVHLGTYAGTASFLTSAVPEPSTWLQMLAGFAAIAVTLRHAGRRRRAIAA